MHGRARQQRSGKRAASLPQRVEDGGKRRDSVERSLVVRTCPSPAPRIELDSFLKVVKKFFLCIFLLPEFIENRFSKKKGTKVLLLFVNDVRSDYE